MKAVGGAVFFFTISAFLWQDGCTFSSSRKVRMLDVLRRYWLAGLLAVCLVIALIRFRGIVPISFDGQTVLILGIAAVLIFVATRFFFGGPEGGVAVRYVVAFDAVVFIVLGSAATVLACSRWETAVLLAGSSLLIGGFVGLLFGYPQGVAQAAAQTGTGAAGQAANAAQNSGQNVNAAGTPSAPIHAPIHAQNLVAESAATLGKVIAGFTLARVQGIGEYFSTLANQIAPALGSSDPATAAVLAGVIMTYFLATGFLCGVFLPPYFMSEVL